MRLFFNFFIALIIAITGVATSSCGGNSQKSKPVITVSIEPQRFLLEKIVKDSIEINVLLSNGSNPETFNPTMEAMKQIAKSDAYLSIGLLGFESALINNLKSNNPELDIIDTSRGITLIEGGHSGHGEGYDPHVWSSIKNAKIIAKNMLDAVLAIDPINKDFYTQNYDNLIKELDDFDAKASQMLSQHIGDAFVVWHPSLSYFARDYGLIQISVGQEGKEMSPAHTRHCIDEARELGAKVGFVQNEFDSNTESVYNQMGLHTVKLNLLDYNWVDEMYKVIDAISKR